MHSSTAVEALIGSLPDMRAAPGNTAATGSRAQRMMRKPRTAFQNPRTVHGKMTVRSASRAISRVSIPPGASARAASHTTPEMVAITRVANNGRRHTRLVSSAAARASVGNTASVMGLSKRTLRTGFIRYEEHRRHAPMPKALWYVGPGIAELREEPLAPGPDDILVRAQFGAISRGTEALIFAGRVPASEYQRMRAPHMGGTFPFPVKYGYAVVGRVESGKSDL